jgi:hypothetical protein
MININGKEYDEKDIPFGAKMHLQRVEQLQREVTELQMMLEERQLVLQARQNAVVKAIEEADWHAQNAAESGPVQAKAQGM